MPTVFLGTGVKQANLRAAWYQSCLSVHRSFSFPERCELKEVLGSPASAWVFPTCGLKQWFPNLVENQKHLGDFFFFNTDLWALPQAYWIRIIEVRVKYLYFKQTFRYFWRMNRFEGQEFHVHLLSTLRVVFVIIRLFINNEKIVPDRVGGPAVFSETFI